MAVFEDRKETELLTVNGVKPMSEVFRMIRASGEDPARTISDHCNSCNWPGGLNVPADEQADLEFPEGESVRCGRTPTEFERCPRMTSPFIGALHAAGLCDTIQCPVCRKNATTHGWCARCRVGMVGSVELEGRAAFDAADRALHLLLEANKTATRCESCAAAMVSDGSCPVCGISYRNGRPVKD